MAPLRVALAPLADRIRADFVYGSIAKGRHGATSVVDLMIIADKLDYADVFSARQVAEAELARTVNPNVRRLAEWPRKRSQATGFGSCVAGQPRLFFSGFFASGNIGASS